MPYVLVNATNFEAEKAYDDYEEARWGAKLALRKESVLGDMAAVVRATSIVKPSKEAWGASRHVKVASRYYAALDPVLYVRKRDARWAACLLVDVTGESFYVAEVIETFAVRLTSRSA